MNDDEFYEVEKQANREFREFKKSLKQKFPNLYKVVKEHEKANDEKDSLMCDLFCSRFADKVQP